MPKLYTGATMNLRPLRPDQQQKPHTRWSYQKNSEDFIGWVNKLGIERTFAGRIAHVLDTRFKLRSIALLFLFCLALSFFISLDYDVSYSGFKEGDLARTDIKSPLAFEVIDIDQTNRKRSESELGIPPVYDYDVNLYDQLATRVRTAMGTMRKLLIEEGWPKENYGAQVREFMTRQSDFETTLGGLKISKENFHWLALQKFKPSVESAVVQSLERWRGQKIVEDSSLFRGDRIIVNLLERGSKGEEFIIDTQSLMDVSEVRNRLGSRIYTGFTRPVDIVQITDFVRSLIIPNLTLNKLETEMRRQRNRDAISDVIVPLKKGQVIVREGSPIQKIHVTILNELRKLQASRHQDFISLITALFFLVLIVSYGSFLSRFVTRINLTTKDFVSMGVIVFLVTAIAKFMAFFANAAFIEQFPNVPASFYTYLIPASAGVMIVGLTIPAVEVVWGFSLFMAVVVGLLLEKNLTFMALTFTSSIIAARGVYGCKKRNDLYLAGLRTGLVNALLIFCATLMSNPAPEILKTELLWNTPAGFLSGLLASFIALTLIPLWESLFVYTTDVKLLELSNLNHPLLKEMIVKAPGTYHHSLVVGSMCETAAEAIGANPLLAKVCAYYHDIGKTNHAQYFIENQRAGENRHDHLNPTMSKTILIAHVKDGVEMGLKYKLGKPIIDVIEQHHGTTLISFFYHRAKEHEDADMHETSEDEYRYPGPKPQFREAALCMLADSIEAAARTLDEPTPARLQGIVHTIVQKKFMDGQLDDCSMTLKDLTLIEEAFGKILLGIYHQRIDYPTAPRPSGSKKSHSTTA
ncbi:MAG: HDIG domain-containing protein [Oligoflexia bacterium]|nr:HDIG domain-containing protein [Oligoflexia bacterium]